MAGWHHRLDGHEFEWTPGVGDRQGGLACCDSRGRKESDMTEWLNWTELSNWTTTIRLYAVLYKLFFPPLTICLEAFPSQEPEFYLDFFLAGVDIHCREGPCGPLITPLRNVGCFQFFTLITMLQWTSRTIPSFHINSLIRSQVGLRMGDTEQEGKGLGCEGGQSHAVPDFASSLGPPWGLVVTSSHNCLFPCTAVAISWQEHLQQSSVNSETCLLDFLPCYSYWVSKKLRE